MTELETLQRAKMYVDKLANGINPLTDQPVDERDVVNQVRISRCLFYISSVLQRVIQNDGKIGSPAKIKKVPFFLDMASRARYEYSLSPIPVSEITRRINQLIDTDTMMLLKYRSITGWLVDAGFLKVERGFDGKDRKIPTPAGNEIGIEIEHRSVQGREYDVIVYSEAAQQFLLDNLDAIIERNNRPAKQETEPAEKNAGQLYGDRSVNPG